MEAAMDREETLRNLLEASEIPAERSRLASTRILFTLLHAPSLSCYRHPLRSQDPQKPLHRRGRQPEHLPQMRRHGHLSHVVGLPLATPLISVL
ncbi:hypothetical protein AXF42_Ash000327 [Apostasia shenzhenica]|uniref:Uncharacterized protein n=1 Tax=Apostasia shenzhenica TaxID=1088818 RepID=A0A2I0AG14_9ASPA|nr:hypothetical protein AXF42_Ash000327 [Apostasia shenzhenica]